MPDDKVCDRCGKVEVWQPQLYCWSHQCDNAPQPLPGSYAHTARILHDIFPEYDWDAWKDRMKDED